MKAPLVSVVILNLNGAGYTLKCLDSIKKSAFRDYEIIVVDNGSSDDSVEVLRKRRDIRLIENRKNMGFAEGNNIGVRASRGKFVCLLNNDTLVDRNWLRELVAAAADREVAVCNPKFLDKYEAESYQFRGFGTLGFMQTQIILPLQEDAGNFRSLAASGSAFFKKGLLGEPFDPDYFAYAEDAQLGWRANLMGYKVVTVPKSVVYHEGGATAKSMKVPWDFFFIMAERNRIMNMLTLYGRGTLLKLALYFALYFLFSSLYDHRHFVSRLRAIWWIVSRLSLVAEKRRRMQSIRAVPDERITCLMSCKLYDESHVNGFFLRKALETVNFMLRHYCAIVRLNSIEARK